MKVLVLSVACGDGSPAEVKAALRGIGFVAKEMEESGATPFTFEIPDESTSFRVVVLGDAPRVEEDCCPVCFADWKQAHEPGCERGKR